MSFKVSRAFTLILEPVQRCNLNCSYCYSDRTGTGCMSRETLQAAFEKTARYAERHNFQEIHILWHGGEPLLAGLEFFRSAIRILKSLPSDLRFQHFIQTNGLLLDVDFGAFFRDRDFQIGISLDGPQVLHDSQRLDAGGRGSHAAVLEKVRLLEKEGLAPGFNAVITRPSLGQEREIYRYFQGLGYGFRINPMIPRQHPEDCGPLLLQPGEYGGFLCRLFDTWLSTSSGRVKVSPLDLFLRAQLTGEPYECQQQRTCVGSQLAVKPSGDAALCSRFETHFLGNIYDGELQDLFEGNFCEDLRRRAETMSACHPCKYWSICHGGCPHNALTFTGDHMSKDPLCKDYQLIFTKIHRALAGLQNQPQMPPEP